MRTTLLSLLLLPITLLAQTTFAPIGAKWTYTVHYAFMGDSAILNVESVGDTILQGRACRILSYDLPTSCIQDYRYVSTSNDTVSFWEPITGTFSTLFVANAVTGQQWTTTISDTGFEMSEPMTVTVMTTSTVVIDGVPLTQHILSFSDPAYFSANSGLTCTERLGSAHYLFPWILSFCDGDFVTELRCYEDDQISWQNPEFPQCELSTGLTEHSSTARLHLPSIVRVGERIPLTSNGGTAMRAEAFDARGRVVFDRTFQGTAELVFASAGLHLVRLTDGRSRPVVRRVLVN